MREAKQIVCSLDRVPLLGGGKKTEPRARETIECPKLTRKAVCALLLEGV